MDTMPTRTGSSLSWVITAVILLGPRVFAGKLAPHQLKNLAIGPPLARRQALGDGFLVRLHVLARLADQGSQLLRVGFGIFPQPLVQRVLLGDEVVAPLL